jgi:hypothetical protein
LWPQRAHLVVAPTPDLEHPGTHPSSRSPTHTNASRQSSKLAKLRCPFERSPDAGQTLDRRSPNPRDSSRISVITYLCKSIYTPRAPTPLNDSRSKRLPRIVACPELSSDERGYNSQPSPIRTPTSRISYHRYQIHAEGKTREIDGVRSHLVCYNIACQHAKRRCPTLLHAPQRVLGRGMKDAQEKGNDDET